MPDIFSGSLLTSGTATRPAAPSIATAAAASDISGQPAAAPSPATAAASDTSGQSQGFSAQSQPMGSSGKEGSVTGLASAPAAAAAAQAASNREASLKSDAYSSIAQIQAEPELADSSANHGQQRSTHEAQPAADGNSGPFADANANSSLPFGQDGPFQAQESPFGGSHPVQHAFDSSQNGASVLDTAGDCGSSFFAAQPGDALANGTDPDSFFDDLQGILWHTHHS